MRLCHQLSLFFESIKKQVLAELRSKDLIQHASAKFHHDEDDLLADLHPRSKETNLKGNPTIRVFERNSDLIRKTLSCQKVKSLLKLTMYLNLSVLSV